MTKRSFAPLILAAFLAVVPAPLRASGQAAAQQALKGTVTVVYDGDTLKVSLDGRGDERVRLIGVDTPELDDARERVRLMAFLAKRFAFSRLYRIEVELLPGPEERDAFGRMLAYVRLGDGSIFNVTLVRGGYAHAYFKFPFDVLVLAAVFIPVGFMGGITGAMFMQFAVTIVVSVILSGIVALTLTPALCTLLIKDEHPAKGRFFTAFNEVFDRFTATYVGGVRGVLGRPRTFSRRSGSSWP